jgi:hypothetical protein
MSDRREDAPSSAATPGGDHWLWHGRAFPAVPVPTLAELARAEEASGISAHDFEARPMLARWVSAWIAISRIEPWVEFDELGAEPADALEFVEGDESEAVADEPASAASVGGPGRASPREGR